jgi:hypothetical protein
MRPLNIVVCDDTNNPLSPVIKEIDRLKPKGSPDVRLISGEEIGQLARGLEARRKCAAHGKNDADTPKWGDHSFDTVDLLVLDYNFVDLDDVSGLTGQRLAYLARCYSACKFIVILNQFGTNRFDLTLRDHPETHADIHLGSEQVTNPGLWSYSEWEDFRPWSWPVLPRAIERFEQRVAQVAANLDQPILEWLGLNSIGAALPRAVTQFLKAEDATFRSFVLSSGHGFEPTDVPYDNSVLSHIASSRVAKWLEYMVLSGQDVLIDLPRLLSRFPSLIGGAGLEALAGVSMTPSFEESLGLGREPVSRHAYSRPEWLSRTAWFRAPVMDDQTLKENADGLPPDTDLRFAEDCSKFLPSAETRGFVADLASPYVQRFVRRPGFANVEYQPSIRFSL